MTTPPGQTLLIGTRLIAFIRKYTSLRSRAKGFGDFAEAPVPHGCFHPEVLYATASKAREACRR
jgi:hypothetical protein